jgi:hypothetical protein
MKKYIRFTSLALSMFSATVMANSLNYDSSAISIASALVAVELPTPALDITPAIKTSVQENLLTEHLTLSSANTMLVKKDNRAETALGINSAE